MVKILFVCTGNTCRSPMAAALLQEKLAAWGIAEEFCVSSAGIAAWSGQAASPEAINVMARQGLSLTEHRSRQIDTRWVMTSDLVLAMTRSHKESLLCIAPGVRDKIFTLAEYVGATEEIHDPFGRELPAYQVCAARLSELLEAARDKFFDLAGKNGGNGENKPDIWQKG